MAKLVLKEFRCVEDTDESGAESPYFIVYVGDLETGGTALKLIRQGNWHDEVDKGELWSVNATVASGFSFKQSSTLILVAMVEEDGAVGINSAEMTIIKSLLDGQFKNFRDTGTTSVGSAVSGALRGTLQSMVTASVGDDDLMGVIRLKPTGQPGPQPLLNYFADTGHYRVRFTVQN